MIEQLLQHISIPTLMCLIPLLPLLGAIANGKMYLFSTRSQWKPSHALSGTIAVVMPLISFLIVAVLFYIAMGLEDSHSVSTGPLFTWFGGTQWAVTIGLKLDQLSLIMALVVTGVGSLIHLYSVGYMSHDDGFAKYFAYLNLFLFFMLLLILGDSLPLMFVGWEGVGLCSYLLIGFWFTDIEKAKAGKKAFIVNRIGDFGFVLGIFFIWQALQPTAQPGDAILSFSYISTHAAFLAPVATAATLLLFLGATGKSAQIPLYVWLPDAMAGPTPVSALIHAATMVTAGIYMVARLNFLFVLAPTTLNVIAIVGCATAFFAATMGLVQDDIKKVLAYSTVSQLGFMFLALGVGAFSVAIFHVMTHAFFKALLFLGSGSVIHAMDGEQRLSMYGGLRKHLPVTFTTFLIGTLAIAGIWPFAGFFSKDAILWHVYSSGHFWLWLIATLAAGLTAFYMFRLVGLAFFGKRNPAGPHHVHPENSVTMLLPLVVLAVLSIIGGWVGVPHAMGGHDHIMTWLAPLFPTALHEAGNESTELFMGLGSMTWGAIWAIIAWILYSQHRGWADQMAARFKRCYTLLVNLYYVDQIYDAVVVQPLLWFSRSVLWQTVDAVLIDKILVGGSARIARLFGRVGTAMETGLVPHYVFLLVLGSVVVLGWMIL
ncbi:MAG: NADH-quinone oxidoreductase subunit L [Deltaproteobacteria bacterium CG11_big_fil_rev_8_21_14_0_20_47_16]|nr:MAG: NADH-quinone oxidoreductase subunit L [Deltaproteobacteria bacterium CG11_big_fil_rev_8_21_14_0_20_47_16]